MMVLKGSKNKHDFTTNAPVCETEAFTMSWLVILFAVLSAV